MIQFDCVYKAFGDKTVVSAFTKTFDTGIYALTGPSGSGKTTILRLAAGLETPDAGTVTLSGTASFAFQEPRLIPWIKIFPTQLCPVPVNAPTMPFRSLNGIRIKRP